MGTDHLESGYCPGVSGSANKHTSTRVSDVRSSRMPADDEKRSCAAATRGKKIGVLTPRVAAVPRVGGQRRRVHLRSALVRLVVEAAARVVVVPAQRTHVLGQAFPFSERAPRVTEGSLFGGWEGRSLPLGGRILSGRVRVCSSARDNARARMSEREKRVSDWVAEVQARQRRAHACRLLTPRVAALPCEIRRVRVGKRRGVGGGGGSRSS